MSAAFGHVLPLHLTLIYIFIKMLFFQNWIHGYIPLRVKYDFMTIINYC